MNRDFRQFLQYIGTSMLGMLIAGSFSIVDTIFIGRGVGEYSLASVAVTWPLVMLLAAFGDAFGMGASVLISQAHGAGDGARARQLFGNMLALTLGTSVLLTALTLVFLTPLLRLLGATEALLPEARSYARILVWGMAPSLFMMECITVIRNDGHPQLSMWMLILGLLGNGVGDWLCIMVWKLGVAGAAYATVASQLLVGLAAVGYFRSAKTTLQLSWANWRWQWRTVYEILVVGSPAFGNSLTVITMLFLHNYQSLRYGKETGLAAYTMVATLESLGSLLMTGLADGVQPLASYLHGAKQYDQQRKMRGYGYRLAFGLGIGLMLFSYALRKEMPVWLGLTEDVAQLAEHGILISSTAFVLLGVVRFAGVYYQAIGAVRASALLIYGDAFVALPICLLILPHWLGMDGIWLAMPVSRVMLFGLLCWMLARKAGES